MINITVLKDGKEMRVEIRRMGLGVMRALEKWGFMGLSQLDGLIFHKGLTENERINLFFNCMFEGKYQGASYRVLRRLERWGMVEVHRYANVPRVYMLSVAGHRTLIKEQINRFEVHRNPPADSLVKHELLVGGIGLTLSELLGLSVSTEFERQVLSRGREQVRGRESFPLPDLWISDPREPKAIEVERTLKSMKRYRKLWTFYRNNLPGSAVVLYVAAFPNGPRLLVSLARKLTADFIYVCGLDEFRRSLGRCAFVGYRGGEIRLEPRHDRPQWTHSRRVATASPSARPGFAGPGDGLPDATFAPPPQSLRIGELTPSSGRGQFTAPPAMRPDPLPHPPSPSPSPEGGHR